MKSQLRKQFSKILVCLTIRHQLLIVHPTQFNGHVRKITRSQNGVKLFQGQFRIVSKTIYRNPIYNVGISNHGLIIYTRAAREYSLLAYFSCVHNWPMVDHTVISNSTSKSIVVIFSKRCNDCEIDLEILLRVIHCIS